MAEVATVEAESVAAKAVEMEVAAKAVVVMVGDKVVVQKVVGAAVGESRVEKLAVERVGVKELAG